MKIFCRSQYKFQTDMLKHEYSDVISDIGDHSIYFISQLPIELYDQVMSEIYDTYSKSGYDEDEIEDVLDNVKDEKINIVVYLHDGLIDYPSRTLYNLYNLAFNHKDHLNLDTISKSNVAINFSNAKPNDEVQGRFNGITYNYNYSVASDITFFIDSDGWIEAIDVYNTKIDGVEDDSLNKEIQDALEDIYVGEIKVL